MEGELIIPVSPKIILELNAYKWGSIISGWKKRILMLDEYSIHIIKSKTDVKRHNNITTLSLKTVKIIDEDKKKQFLIKNDKKKISIKVNNEDDKYLFIEKVTLAKENLKKKNNSSLLSSKNDISNNDKTAYTLINKESLLNFQKKIDKINENLIQLQTIELEIKSKSKEKYKSILSNIFLLNEDLKKETEKLILTQKENIDSFLRENNQSSYISKLNKEKEKKTELDSIYSDAREFPIEIEEKKKKNLNEEEEEEGEEEEEEEETIDMRSLSSDEYDNEKLDEIKNIQDLIIQSDFKERRFKKSLSKKLDDFIDFNYNQINRKNLPYKLHCPDSMIKDLIKSLTSKKISFPINYNEPISMLQKQCEKFLYSDLLEKASEETISNEKKIIYIIGFIAGELSQNINRYLKPFNPILGETFEYYNNDKRYRYFSEQVSHNPAISAYVGESKNFCYYGDTRFKNSYKFFKGAMEIKFTNKTHVIFKKTNDKFVFNKPIVYLVDLMSGTPKYDYDGVIYIEDVNNKDIKGEVKFIEGKKNDNDINIEGNIYKGGNIVYKVKGNWRHHLYYYTKKDESDKNIIWNIHDDPSLKNTLDNYVLPNYSLNLNYINDDLKRILPKTDSRLRPDQREYENGNIEEATKLRKIIEDNQRNRHKKFDEDKIIYEPVYFSNLYSQDSSDFVYMFNGNYFNERIKGNFSEKLVDIFAIK